MKRRTLLIGHQLLVASICLVQTGNTEGTTLLTTTQPQGTHTVTTPGNVPWKPFVPPGSEMAVLAGNPDEAGAPFVIRIKNPDGAKIPPHWHPGDEHITVLAGTFVVGMGRTFDPAVGQELPVGSYMLVPKQLPHFAWAKGDVIIQVHGIGPFQVNWVNPADDPTKKPGSR